MSDGSCQQEQDGLEVGNEKNITPTTPPPKPIPSKDPKLASQARTPPPLHVVPTTSSQDLFKLSPLAAMKLLSGGVEALVRMTGDIPPTPPPTSPTIPHMRGMQREKAAIVRSHSQRNLSRLREQQAAAPPHQQQQQGFFDTPPATCQPIDGVHLRQTPTPPPPSTAPEPYIVIGANSQPLNLQHSAITRKFFSKAPPPISIEDYLLRIHRFCPMSTAVYLATSFYIFRLAVEERAIPVTRRNCHRLLLAGLRVAMKALEDLSYPHAKIAQVGGVSEVELARLEISFCFLAGFELVVREETLMKHWETLKQDQGPGGVGVGGTVPILKLDARRKRALSQAVG
ncbi:Uu.00g061820.m01.CDS01 [Anthostomella pinea]|uniref:Uu.00g061820.m01.CDS01 n=1 Tax=Anthostomella pinea TaxID=933095 RepID=A0AAI8VSI7_9PEZI|nr:Uu.00g061820.m01.CDS01 [Anthostomella pinea]